MLDLVNKEMVIARDTILINIPISSAGYILSATNTKIVVPSADIILIQKSNCYRITIHGYN